MMWELVGRFFTAVFGGVVVFYLSMILALLGRGGLEAIPWALVRSAVLGVRAMALVLLLSGCAVPRELTPTEVRGLAMLHELREVAPDEGCCCD